MPLSRHTPSRFGPSHCGQSSARSGEGRAMRMRRAEWKRLRIRGMCSRFLAAKTLFGMKLGDHLNEADDVLVQRGEIFGWNPKLAMDRAAHDLLRVLFEELGRYLEARH